MKRLLIFQTDSVSLNKAVTLKISILGGIKLFCLQVSCLKTNVLEGLYNMRIRESAQLQTVLAMHAPEMDQHRLTPHRSNDQNEKLQSLKLKGLKQEYWSRIKREKC